MAAVTYYLFLDGREDPAVVAQANKGIRVWNQGAGRHYQAPFGPTTHIAPITALSSVAGLDGVPPLEMCFLLRGIDWAYPAQLVYREEGEHRWSQVAFGLSLREEAAG